MAPIVETVSDRQVHCIVLWRRTDLKGFVARRVGGEYHERTIGKLLKDETFFHLSARPRHPKQDGGVIQAFKKAWRALQAHVRSPEPLEGAQTSST